MLNSLEIQTNVYREPSVCLCKVAVSICLLLLLGTACRSGKNSQRPDMSAAYAKQASFSKANGYKGIWFTLGQFSEYGDKYSGGLGTYTANHLPVATYAKEVNKTFFVYGGTTSAQEKHLLIMVSYYDHQRKRVP